MDPEQERSSSEREQDGEERAEDGEEREQDGEEGAGAEDDSERLDEERIDAAKARKLIATSGTQPIDIRDADSFSAGHIAGGVRVEEGDLDSEFEDRSKDDPVIVVCQDGERSAQVAETLRERGFNAASIEGGMDAWSGDSLPLQPGEDEEFEGPRRPGPLGA